MFSKFQKSAALIITLVIIGSVGTMALVVARSTIMGVRISTNLYAEMVAEETSLAGIELYLRDRNDFPAPNGVGYYGYCNLENDISDIFDNCWSAGMPSMYPTDYWVGIQVEDKDPSDDYIEIYTTGHYGGVVKKHYFKFNTSASPQQFIQEY